MLSSERRRRRSSKTFLSRMLFQYDAHNSTRAYTKHSLSHTNSSGRVRRCTGADMCTRTGTVREQKQKQPQQQRQRRRSTVRRGADMRA
eukprot:6199177-Pleurochrysis_carterae.AAC.3